MLPASAATDGTSERVRQALRDALQAALALEDRMDVDGAGAAPLVTYQHEHYEVVSEAWIAACESSERRAPEVRFRI